MTDKAVITCALTGVLTDPTQHPVPVTPAEMAREARAAFDAGAAIVRCAAAGGAGKAICRRGIQASPRPSSRRSAMHARA